MNKYESVIIINPSVDEEKVKSLVDRFSELINKNGKVEKHGEREEMLPQIFNKVKPCHKLEKNEKCSEGRA